MKYIHKKTLRDEVRIKIQEAILNGKLVSGERIIETKIAEELGVSQSPVREAIRELTLMGLVENAPFTGTYVRVVTKKYVEDIYVMRAELEEYATREATRHMGEEELEKLRLVLEQMENSVRDKNVDDFTRYDNEFHKVILETANNSLLERFWELGLPHWTYVTTCRMVDDDFETEMEIHYDIYESMANRDALKAAKLAKENVLALKDKILAKINLDDYRLNGEQSRFEQI